MYYLCYKIFLKYILKLLKILRTDYFKSNILHENFFKFFYIHFLKIFSKFFYIYLFPIKYFTKKLISIKYFTVS